MPAAPSSFPADASPGGRAPRLPPTVRAPRSIFPLLVWLVLSTGALTGPATAQEDSDESRSPLVFGVFPFVASSALEEGFGPFLAQLQEELGRPVSLRTTRRYDQFMHALEAGRFDIAYVQPFDYVRLAQQVGYEPLGRRQRPLRADVVVSARSAIQNVDELRGRILGLPPKVAAVSYLARGLLRRRGLDDSADADSKDGVRLKYFRTHDSCLQALLLRSVDACAVGDTLAEAFAAKMGRRLRIIEQTPSIPPSLLVVHRRLGKERIAALRAWLPDLEPAPETAQILGLGAGRRLLVPSPADYEPVRRIWQSLAESPAPDEGSGETP